MSDRRLVVTELDPADPHYGEVFALATNNATAVPVPAFRFGNAKPPVGSAVGEAFYETTSQKGWVWDGAAWREIAATPLRTYPTETALKADTAQLNGTYAIATDTGSLFIKQAGGWAFVGIRDYASTANLLADPASTGQLGLALDDDTLWQMTPNGWRAMSIRHMADTAAIQAWVNPPGTPAGNNPQGVTRGDQAVDLLHEVMYARTATGWKPETIWEETEANIRAATWCLVGQEAIATDTGRTFVYTTSGWIEEPIRHYATQVALLADTPVSNTFAWAEDTGNMFTYVQARGWIGMNSSMDDPIPIGALLDFPSRAIPNGWLECNGQTIPADAKYDDLRTLLGTATVPDLRGYFNRASKDGEAVLSKHRWTTGMPRTAFTATTSANGAHGHGLVDGKNYINTDGGGHNLEPGGGGAPEGWSTWRYEGNHSHTVTISGGGDTETAPDHVIVVRCIKAFHITATVPGPDRLLTAITAPTNRQVLSYDAATGSWKNGAESVAVSVGGTAPTSPATGDFWLNTTAKPQTLNVWNGTAWINSTGAALTEGAVVALPGYFNENPSATATADDLGGIAFRYSSSQSQLWLEKGGNWHPVTPMLGDSSNENKPIIADSNGNPSWGPALINTPRVKWLDSTDSGGQNQWTQDLPNPQRYIKWHVSGASNADHRLELIMEQNNNWWDWSTHVAEAQAVTSYESSGVREEQAGIMSGWWSDNSGGKITEENGSYIIKGNTTWHCVGHILLASDRAMLMVDTSYTSDNNTPMRCIFRARWDQDMRHCNKLGFKLSSGTGWFVGHIEYT